MSILKYVLKKNIITVSYQTPLLQIVKIINDKGENQTLIDIKNSYINCICVVEKSKFLGILRPENIIKLITSIPDWRGINAGKLICPPVINLTQGFDVKLAFSLMQKHHINHLPIVDESGNFLGIVTSENIAELLQAQLLETGKQLQDAIQHGCALEAALAETQARQETVILERTKELEENNKLLQRAICDRIATEAQLLQTTSELQELFQAFPDVYFRLNSDGTILSHHGRKISNLDFTTDEFVNNKLQEIFPNDVGCKFQQAILQLHQTNSLVVIEYSLPLLSENKTFEARLLPSIQYQTIVKIRNITEFKQAEKYLQQVKDKLEVRVEERTKELKQTNELLLQEIIERQRIEDTLRYRVELEKLITTISTYFINLTSDEIDNGINQALEAICKFLEVESSYISLFNNDKNKIDIVYEWHCEEIQNLIIYKTDINFLLSPWIIEKISRFEIVYIPSINNVINVENSVVRNLLEKNIQSLIILPIICSGTLIGSLIFTSVRLTKNWTEESLNLLKMVGEMLGNIIRRKRVEQALRVSEERYARAINAGKVGIWELNIKTDRVYIDSNLKAMLGYSEHEISDNFHDWLNLIHPQDIESFKLELDSYLKGLKFKYEIQHRMRHKNGNYLWFLARGTLTKDREEQPDYIAGSNTDITTQKQIEDRLKISLKEKYVLLKELHHRVKNNLQIISSLLRLQARNIQEPKILNVFQDSQNRIRAMAIIHEKLYQSTDLAKIKIYDYIKKITSNLLDSYQVNNNIEIKLNIENFYLKIDTTIICGLIINELVSNSIEHAFTDNNQGKIKIIFSNLGNNQYLLNVSDNGVGITKDYFNQEQSIGLQLVWNLVEQIEGSISCYTTSGASFNITFFEQN